MQRSVESIEQQSLRMAEMVGELLDASRIRRGKFELSPPTPVDLVMLAQKVAERRAVLHPQHDITVEASEPEMVGMWDAARIEQVLHDLVDNAARHSPYGGQVAVHIWRKKDTAFVAVRDTGIGIAQEDRERIFDYLYRTPHSESRNLSGLGLGLFVSRHIVEQHGGQLVLHETSTLEPSGSEFRFTLPLS
jgi:signal transduction histidine kinase